MTNFKHKIIELFFNYPTKQWHFNEIKKSAPMADSKLSKWLHKLIDEKIILRIKDQGKMPYYAGNYESSEYRNTKRIFGLNMLNDSGLLNYLASLDAKTVIVFGSFSRWDWHKDSDVDIFIYGKADEEGIKKYNIGREIQIFHCVDRKDFEKYSEGLIKEIISGDIIKGNIDYINVKI